MASFSDVWKIANAICDRYERMSIELIAAPVVEPVTLAEAKLQLGFGPMEDSDHLANRILADKLRSFIATARQVVEDQYCHSVFITQTWLLRLDGFPGSNWSYERGGYAQIDLPKPPFQSLQFLRYIDTAGAVQPLTIDTTSGVNAANPQYGYQLGSRGNETQPARIMPPFARPWPPTRMVPSNVMAQFRCGYGGPLTVSVNAGSALVTVQGGYTFNPLDGALLAADPGMRVSIPGAGAAGATLNTNIASVDVTGNATLRDAATTSVVNVTGWFGNPVPKPITTAIKFLVEHYYDHGGCEDAVEPRAIRNLLGPYWNGLS